MKTQIDSGIAKPIQDMAAEALTSDQGWVTSRNQVYQQRRDLCLATLNKMGLAVETPKGAFYIWFRAPAGFTSLQFHTDLLDKGHISTTPGHIYGVNGEGWLRISLVAPTARLQEALARLEKVMKDQAG